MTREEAIKILSVLKAAYPNSYRGMTKDEANGTVNVWQAQFANVPYFVVSLAVNKLIGTNTFPPAINEVKDKMTSLYFEAQNVLDEHRRVTEGVMFCGKKIKYPGKPLDDRALEMCQKIVDICSPYSFKNSSELSLRDMLSMQNESLIGSPDESHMIK